MATIVSGNDAQMTIAAVEQPVIDWEFTEESSEIDTTNATDAATEQSWLPGRAGATFSANIFVETAVAEPVVGGEAGLAIELIAKQGTTDKKWAFNGIILSVGVGVDVPGTDAAKIALSGRVNGAITRTQFTV